MYNDLFLKFANVTDAEIVLGAHGIPLYRDAKFNQGGETDTNVTYNMDVIFGTGAIYHDETQVDGFHVNMRFNGTAPDFGSNVITPAMPKCIFA